MRVALKTVAGVVAFRACALDLHTIGKQARSEQLGTSPARIRKIRPEKSLSAGVGKTRNARKDAMPHERGPSPVPPSEFSCPAIADPKARFCRSPASHSPFVNGISAIPLTLRHLNSPSVRYRSAWLCSSQRTLACPAAHLKTRHPILAQSPEKGGMSRKDAQPLS